MARLMQKERLKSPHKSLFYDNPDAASGSATSLSGVVNAAAAPAGYEESLALAQALSLSMSDSVTPAGDAASDAAQDSDGNAADPSTSPMPDFDDPGAASDSDSSLTEMVAAAAAA